MGSGANSSTSGDAFSLYLQARCEWGRRTPASIRKAIRHLERAIALNGSFSLACAALADCYSILMDYGVLSPEEGMTQARLAAGRALLKGPDLAESLTSAALVRQMDLDWEAAEAEFDAAIRAHPGYAVARQRFALFLAGMGRWEESRRQVEVARTLDPHSPVIAASAAWIDYYQGRLLPSIRASESILSRHPGFPSAAACLASSLAQDGRAEAAADVLEESLGAGPDNVSLLALLAYVQGRKGGEEEAGITLARLLRLAGHRYVSPYYRALPLLGMSRKQEAQAALEEAEAERSPQLVSLGVDPVFAPIRAHPSFQRLLARLRLPRTPSVERLRPDAPLQTRAEVA